MVHLVLSEQGGNVQATVQDIIGDKNKETERLPGYFDGEVVSSLWHWVRCREHLYMIYNII